MVRLARASCVVLTALVVVRVAVAAAPPPGPLWEASALPQAARAAPAAPGPIPTPTPPVAGPPSPSPVAGEETELVVEEVAVEDNVEGPASDEPVAWVEGRLTVKGKKPKRPKKPEAELSDEVKAQKKEWLSEVCPVGEEEGSGTWLDRSQDRLGWSVCRATIWFDGLFGDERAIEERDATYGYLQPRLEWSDHDGVDAKLRMRAKINLPVADRRFNALLGRSEADEDDPGGSRQGGNEQLPESFRTADDEWLLGLGYSPVRGSRRRMDFDGGVKLGAPVELFAQGRYRRHWFLSNRDLVRARQTVFWRSDDGLGTALHVDVERVLRGPYVARWRNGASLADNSRGVEWFEELTVFQRLGDKTALAYVLSADGATDADVPVSKYALELVFRRNILREWLYVELRPGLDWRRRERHLDREIEPVLGVSLQIHFGDREFE